MLMNEFVYNNEEESEMAQLHAIHIHLNAIAAHRAKMAVKGPSLEFCEECGEPIPKARQEAVPGVTLCIDCKEREEKRSGERASISTSNG